jgi:hypothetical protein
VAFAAGGAWIVVETGRRIETLPADPLAFARGLEIPAPIAPPRDQGPRPALRYLIGCLPPSGSAGDGLPIGRDARGEVLRHRFDLDAAEKQRQQAQAGGAGKGEFQLSDDAGRPLPVWWVPWKTPTSPGVSAGSEGMWVYEPVDWSGPKAFTSAAFDRAREGRDQSGRRAIAYDVVPERQEDFHRFTSAHVARSLCLVVDGELWCAAVIEEPLRNQVLIRGGGTGFTAEECRLLLRAFGR